jgi:hypothetical protein
VQEALFYIAPGDSASVTFETEVDAGYGEIAGKKADVEKVIWKP